MKSALSTTNLRRHFPARAATTKKYFPFIRLVVSKQRSFFPLNAVLKKTGNGTTLMQADDVAKVSSANANGSEL
jgi:hypothetical protein